jgi:hypothetical protein
MRRNIAVLALLLSACATVPTRVSVEGITDRLFCGRNIPGGGSVTQADIDTFVDEVVSREFPEGFTVYEATGVYRKERERTIVIEIVHPYGKQYDDKVLAIAAAYRERFHQNSVLRVMEPSRLEFVQ